MKFIIVLRNDTVFKVTTADACIMSEMAKNFLIYKFVFQSMRLKKINCVNTEICI